MPKGTCPDCDGDVQLAPDAATNDIVECEDCGSDLEIVGLDPIELDVVEDFMHEDEEEDDY